MSWMELINPTTGVWRGVEAYAAERIAELTLVCVSAGSSDQQIRQAQAGIEELHRLASLPARIQATTQQQRAYVARTGY